MCTCTPEVAIIELVDMGGRTFGIDDFRHVINARLHKLYPLRYELVDIPFKFHHPMWRRTSTSISTTTSGR